MRDNRMIVLLHKELLKASLNLGLDSHMPPEFLGIPSLKQDGVPAVILIQQGCDIPLWNRLHIFAQLVHRICIHFPAKLHLGLYLITLGNRYIPHVVGKPGHPYMAALHDAHRGAHPTGNASLHLLIAPVSHDYLALNAHAGNHVAIFPVPVGGLVLIHEIHINGIIWNLLVELCVEMHQRLPELLKSQDP